MRKLLLILLLLPVLTGSTYSLGNNEADSLFIVLKKAKHDTDKVNLYLKIGQYYHSAKPDSARYFYRKAFTLSESSGYFNGKARSISFFGYLKEDEGNYNDAINFYLQALSIFKSTKSTKEVANHYNFIGLCYNYKGDYINAVKSFQESMSIYEAAGDSGNISKCLLNLGLAFYNNQDYDKAEEYLKDAISIKERINDLNGLGICYLNLGNIFSLKKDFKRSLEYYNKSCQTFEEFGELLYLAYCQTNIGNIYMQNSEFDKAIDYFNKATENCRKVNDNNLLIVIKLNLGQLYSKTNRYNLAIETVNESVKMAKDLGILPSLKDGYLMLSEIYKSGNDFENSLKYYELGTDIKDSLYNLDKNQQLQELSAKYESEQKENQIKIQQAKLTATEAEVDRAETQKWAVLVSAILILIVAVVVFYNFLRNKKANRVLQEKNSMILQQKAEISVIAENLENVNKELEKLSIVASETDNAVIIASPEGEIEWVNDGFSRLFGYGIEEFKQTFGPSLQTGSENNNISDLIERSITLKQPITYTTENKTKAGKKLWTQTTLTPIIKNNVIVKLIAIDSDITRLKLAEEEVMRQRSELMIKSGEIMEINNALEKRNQQITENINYAQKIQSALLPAAEQIQRYFPDSFIIHRPRDIVSGDFYWFHRSDKKIFIAVVDCTGHGVSGAFMSMIGTVLLNEIVVHKGISSPAKVVSDLDNDVTFALNKHSGQLGSDDGMDITFCTIDFTSDTLSYTSANQTFYYLNSENSLIIDNGDIFSVGGSLGTIKKFTEKTLDLNSVSTVYLSTDGYSDQFGGGHGQKFMTKRFVSLIEENKNISLKEQYNVFDNALNTWIGSNDENTGRQYSQTDDISLIGISLKKENLVIC